MNSKQLEFLQEELCNIYAAIIKRSEPFLTNFPLHDEDSIMSRDNLLAYLAFRKFDIHHLQFLLLQEGLSSLGRLESNVLTSIENVLKRLHYESDVPATTLIKPDFEEAQKIIQQRKLELFRSKVENRNSHIMVTLDKNMLENPGIFEKLLMEGMNIARINCAHDDENIWKELIDTLHSAERALKEKGRYKDGYCSIYMDLGGPKIRTGKIKVKKHSLKIKARRDGYGKIVELAKGIIDSKAQKSEILSDGTFVLAIAEDLHNLKAGENLEVTGTCGRTRKLQIIEVISPTKASVILSKNIYIGEGTVLHGLDKNYTIRSIEAKPLDIYVQKGDKLHIYKDPNHLGHSATENNPASISCLRPDVLDHVKVGDRIFIDDGKITTVVTGIHETHIEVSILLPEIKPKKIKEEKGLNFPDSIISLPALTDQDKKHLRFVAKYADIVGLSFVHTPNDLLALNHELEELGRTDIGVVAKIETNEAIRNLSHILLTGLTFKSFGIMIARGDLAVEVGFENLSHVQEDILCICEAAHIPVIWATQVLESLAKKGVPARAEITDAAMGNRAECVMLNKGPHIVDAVQVLSTLLEIQAKHHLKKRQVFTEFTEQKGLF